MENKDLIDKINKLQENPYIKIDGVENHWLYPNGFPIHPLTCGNNSNHKVLKAIEKDYKVILICEDCDYEQSYLPDLPI